ncbi:MAG: cobalamin-independent methionine synthase II family protein [Clostridiales bacterium]|jgi:methionine synthase II (cobalamin-independent)|nr:cobalamin-independent methionine synthase II family protein [Clostridiales bacterium]
MSNKFQTVGSLLRPEKLLAYKRQIEVRDDIEYPFYSAFAGYEECETAAVKSVVKKQIERGLSVITDGEYTKSMWHLDFVWGLSGVKRYIAPHGYFFRDKDEKTKYETRKDIGLRITAPLSGKNHHFINTFKRLQAAAEGHETKLCIPSPSHIFGELSWSDNVGGKNSVYASSRELKEGLTKAYIEFVGEYAAAGGKILQMDDCLWEIFADDNPNSPYTGKNADKEGVFALADEFIEINNAVIAFGHSRGLKVWTHNCRGNYDSRNMGGGSYVKIAELFLKRLEYDRFFLEWDDGRAGPLDALYAFKNRPGAEVVLGLLSSKTNTLDDEARAVSLLDEAAKILPKERLLLSHQCGFASCDGGNELTEAEQWAKIDQGMRIAEEYWKI